MTLDECTYGLFIIVRLLHKKSRDTNNRANGDNMIIVHTTSSA